MPQTRPNYAIFDPKAPARLIAAAADDYEWGLAWLILNEGMHPAQIRKLGPKNFDETTGMLQWVRVKNERPRHTLIPDGDRERLVQFLRSRKLSTVTTWSRITKLGLRVGYPATPRNLRKTFIINELRRFHDRPDCLDLVAARAGCTKAVVIQHYLDLEQWTRLNP